MRLNGLSDLDTAHILFNNIADNLALVDNGAACECHSTAKRLNVGDNIAVLILLHFVGFVVEVIAHGKGKELSCVTCFLCDLDFQFCHRRLVRGQNNIFKIEIFVRAAEVLNLKALDLNLLNELFVKGIQSVQHIHKVVLLGMSGRVVEAEQRVKVFECLLRNLAAHFLRLVKNDDRSVRLYNINRTARAELITLGVNNAGLLAFPVLFQGRGESLGIDNHDIYAGAGGEVVKLVKVRTVVDEEASLLVVLLHKVVGSHFKGFFDTLTDSNARHNDNELTPAVTLVQFKHGLDIDIGFTRAGLHLNIKRAAPDVTNELIRGLDIVLALYGTDVFKQLSVGQLDSFILIAGVTHNIIVIIIEHGELHLLICLGLAQVTDICSPIVVRLPVKHTDNRIYGFGLILLYLKIKLHLRFSSPSRIYAAS